MKTPIEFFEAHLAAEGKRPATIRQYGDFLHRFERFLTDDFSLNLNWDELNNISGLHLSAFLQELMEQGREISTRNNYTVILKLFFGYLKAIDKIDKDPSLILHCVKEKRTPETIARNAVKRYGDADITRLLAAILKDKPRLTDLRDAAILALILGSGLRAFEVCALNVRQAEEIRAGALFCLRKGGDWSHVSVADYVAAYVDRYLVARGHPGPDEPLFVSQKGNRMERKALWSALATKQSQLNLKTGLHIFRHTLLTAVDQNGGSALARDIGGHTSVQITNEYMHPSMDERRKAVCTTSYARDLSSLAPIE